VQRFDEKPAEPRPMPGTEDVALASMGIYVFNRSLLTSCLISDAQDPASRRDFGRDVIPAQLGRSRVLAHSFRDPRTGRQGYWRDVGTLDSYWRANMDLLDDDPRLDLYDPSWRIWTRPSQCPPPRFIGDGMARRSIVSCGCTVAGVLERSVASTGCHIGAGSRIESSVILPNVQIGEDCRIRGAIIDSGCEIPDGTVIGDARDGCDDICEISAGGIALVTKETLEQLTRHLEHLVA
jgi:glucose-1-phosphate adenylyltransferase